MRKQPIIIGVALLIVSSLLCVPVAISAEVVWTIGRELDLKTPPLDISASADGKWLYILSVGEIAVYSFANGTIVNRIPIDKTFDRMVYVKEKNLLVVTSHAGNTVQIIELEIVNQFNLSGLPYKGPKNAPVAVVVFSDYQ